MSRYQKIIQKAEGFVLLANERDKNFSCGLSSAVIMRVMDTVSPLEKRYDKFSPALAKLSPFDRLGIWVVAKIGEFADGIKGDNDFLNAVAIISQEAGKETPQSVSSYLLREGTGKTLSKGVATCKIFWE